MFYLCVFSSTVQFAQEVAKRKVMDDTIDDIEDIFGIEKSQDINKGHIKGKSFPVVMAESGNEVRTFTWLCTNFKWY